MPEYGYGQRGMAYTGPHLGAILIERGDLAGRAPGARGRRPGPVDSAALLAAGEDGAAARRGQARGGARDRRRAPARGCPWIVNPTDAYWRSYKAQALDRLERTDEAIELLHEELELAREWGAPATVGRVLRVLGTIDRDNAIEHLTESVELLERSTTRLEYAKALCALGTAIRLRAQAERGPRAALPGARAGQRLRRRRRSRSARAPSSARPARGRGARRSAASAR